MVVEVEQPNIAPSVWPRLVAKTPEFEQTPVAMPPLLVVRVRGSREDRGTNALPSRLVLGGGCRTSSHARIETYSSATPEFKQANEQKRAYGSSKFRRGYRTGSLGLTFIQGCKSTSILISTVPTSVHRSVLHCLFPY